MIGHVVEIKFETVITIDLVGVSLVSTARLLFALPFCFVPSVRCILQVKSLIVRIVPYLEC